MKDRDLDAVTDCGNHLPKLAASDMNVIVLRRWSGTPERPWPHISHGRGIDSSRSRGAGTCKGAQRHRDRVRHGGERRAARSRYRARPIERAAWPAADSTAGPRITAATCRLARSTVRGRS